MTRRNETSMWRVVLAMRSNLVNEVLDVHKFEPPRLSRPHAVQDPSTLDSTGYYTISNRNSTKYN